jgi:hypothetical protein
MSPTVRHRLWRVASAVAIGAIIFAWISLLRGDYFHDAKAYWSVDYANLYGGSLVGRFGTYLYSPAFAQAMWPLTLLPWIVFAAVWSALNLAVLIWMARPVLAALLLFIPFSPVADEFSTGNIHLLLAAAIVLSFRYPASHAFGLLTKVTPGISAWWLLGAGRTRDLMLALAITAGISAVSLAFSWHQWVDWAALLRASSTVPVPADIGVIPGPLWLRAAAAAVVAVASGRLGWRWGVPVAAMLALPVTWSSGLAILVALVPLYRDAAAEQVGQFAQLRSPRVARQRQPS